MLLTLTLLLLFYAPNSLGVVGDECPKIQPDLPELQIIYEVFDSNAVYETRIEESELGAIYDLTNAFIDAVISDAFPEDLIFVEAGSIQIKNDDYLALLDHYVGLLVFLLFLLIFAILVPIVGIIFGCCRCCGNCGGKQQYTESNDGMWTIIYVVSCVLFGTMFMFGLVFTFGTNEHFEKGIVELVPSVRRSVVDVNSYFSDTTSHITNLLVDNFNPLQEALNKRLNETGDLIYEDFQNTVSSENITETLDILTKIVNATVNVNNIISNQKELAKMITKIDKTKHSTIELLEIINSVILIINDNDLKDKIDQVIKSVGLIENINETVVNEVNFTSINKGLEMLDNSNIIPTVTAGLTQFTEVPNNIKTDLSETIENVQKTINETGEVIQNETDKALTSVNNIVGKINESADYYLDETNTFLKNYSDYRYYPDLTVSIILLAIILLIVIGICFGLICKKPSKKADCFNVKIGGTFLMISVGIMFITTIILVAVAIVHMVGMIAQVMVCEPLKDPRSDILEFLDGFNLLEGVINVNISSVIRECYDDQSVYNVFNLEQVIDLESIKNSIETSGVNDTIQEIIANLGGIDTINIIEEDQLNALNKLKAIQLTSAQFDTINSVAIPDFNASFSILKDDLNSIIDKLNEISIPNFNDFINNLITDISENIIDKHPIMVKHMEALQENAKECEDKLLTDGSFENKIEAITNNINGFQQGLECLPESLQMIARVFTEEILEKIQSYLNNVVNVVENDVGKCGPLATALKGTVAATCDQLMYPLNGFWFSLCWCLFLFVPMIFLSIKMAGLFGKINSNNKQHDRQKHPYYEMPMPLNLPNYQHLPNQREFNIYSEIGNDELGVRHRQFNNDLDEELNRRFGIPIEQKSLPHGQYNNIDDELERRFGISNGARPEPPTRNYFGPDNKSYVPDELENRYAFAKPPNPNNRPNYGVTRF